eukprot:gene9628-6889_t
MFAVGGSGGVQWSLLGAPLYGGAADDKCGMGLALDDSGPGRHVHRTIVARCHPHDCVVSASCRGVVRPDWSQLSCKWLPDRQIALLSSYVPNSVTAVEVLVQGRPVVVSVASQLLYEGALLVADVAKGRPLRGNPYPPTVQAAYTLASTWITRAQPSRTAPDDHIGVFVLSDTIVPSDTKGQAPARRGTPPPRSTEDPSALAAKKAFLAARVCYHCQEKGHVRRNCPKRQQPADKTVQLAMGEDDSMDFDTVNCMVDSSSVALFTETEVLLDTGAGQSVFHNPNLLRNVMRPSYARAVKGVDSSGRGLRISAEGVLADLPIKVSVCAESAANLLSAAALRDAGCIIDYDQTHDRYTVETPSRRWTFTRRPLGDDNLARASKQEVKRAEEAMLLKTRLGHASTRAVTEILNTGSILNCRTTSHDVRQAETLFGPSVAEMKGKTKRHERSGRGLPFLVAVLQPLGLTMCSHVKNRETSTLWAALQAMLAMAKSRGFDCVEFRADGEGGLSALVDTIRNNGIEVNIAGPGQHVPVAERMIQTIKGRVRDHEHALPYTMPRLMLQFCVLYCVRSINFQTRASSTDRTSPYEAFFGRKLDMRRDLRCGFGDYVQATVPVTSNTMAARTEGCICLLPTGNTTGSVRMWCLGTSAVVTRDQFTVVPVTKELAAHITRIAATQGLHRGTDPGAIELRHVSDTDPDLPTLPPADHVPMPLITPPSLATNGPTGLGVTAATSENTRDEAADSDVTADELATLLCGLDASYNDYVEPSGSIVVKLQRALYGCVEAAKLWHDTLTLALKTMGFRLNAKDGCVLNRDKEGRPQVTIVLYVDDLLITSTDREQIEEVIDALRQRFKEVKAAWGPRLSYVGMTLDFANPGEVTVTMANCTADLLVGPALRAKPTPASTALFDIRPEADKVKESDRKEFHTKVAKLLYLAKRTRPECLTAAAFLSTRVQACDIDDCAKLRRVLGYIQATAERGITLKMSDPPVVRAYIDVAYGVHTDSGRSHTGCVVTIGSGPVFAKSAKQKIVTKSSTEAELVGLSDTASQAIHIREFLREQGIATGPAVLGQDNLSTIALTRRGGPGSERSRHIAIRHFWLKERVDNGDVTVVHVRTEDMVANLLTKPVQGAQFTRERDMLTGWTTPSMDVRGVLGQASQRESVHARAGDPTALAGEGWAATRSTSCCGKQPMIAAIEQSVM